MLASLSREMKSLSYLLEGCWWFGSGYTLLALLEFYLCVVLCYENIGIVGIHIHLETGGTIQVSGDS